MSRIHALFAAAGLLLAAACNGGSAVENDPEAFIHAAESELLELMTDAERAGWVQANFITDDTEIISAQASRRLVARTGALARQAARFAGREMSADARRKIALLRTSLPLAAPERPEEQVELSRLSSSLESMYGRGQYCPDGEAGSCRDLGELSKVLATSRDARALLDAWRGWRTVSPPMREKYRRFVELANAGARGLGFADTGAMWRSGYDMDPDAFALEVERLWEQVRPLYEQLHCYVRARLRQHYGSALVPEDGPIPAHLLGNMWGQSWGHIYDLVAPSGQAGLDVGALLEAREVDAEGMVRYGEGFFTSLGFAPLPGTFWERSLLRKPRDRDVVCHASAWDIDFSGDLRIKMCIEINEEDFVTIHHELGHIFYYQSYDHLSPLYRQGANDGFHEAVGDTIALSITPAYLEQVGLLRPGTAADDDTAWLLKTALEKVAFLPFGLLVDQWRWKVFSGEIPADAYNAGWWELREKLQGIAPPVPRSEDDFDPGAKYHVPANTPYMRYFLAHILQFQFHKALCEAAGYRGPLHRCSIYGNEEAGRRLREMLALGRSRPWPDALEALTGSREMDASAVKDYFQPLMEWLEEQNAGRTCGW
ncbi:MAG: M2 family metallopeptidase [Acidobacteriota bacterium]|nr:M2 family metallopeptidase [Acidobacteriota bacterium]MDQ7087177.1 M2 family metallopeptidase [Acidobacteriota bacterium]